MQLLDTALYAGIPPADAHLLLIGTSKSGETDAPVTLTSPPIRPALALAPAPLFAPPSWQAVQMTLCLCTTFLVEHNLDKAGALLALLAMQ